MYDEQLKRYFELFNRDQFHVLTLAELSADPARTTGKIAEFLGIDHAPLRELDSQIFNADGPHEPFSAEADKIMDEAFAGLTERTDRLVGRPLDWSL
jgi:hypothetical protein